jgi:tetratricopeptide (TPR) repeat protein
MSHLKAFSYLVIAVLFTSCDFNSAQSYYDKASKLEDEGKYVEAIALLDKAIDKKPDFISAYLSRGVDKQIVDDEDGSVRDYFKVLEIDSNNTLALYNIGIHFYRVKNYQKALDFYNKAFKTKGGDLIYLDYVPNAFTDRDRYDVPGAEIHFDRGLVYYELDSLQKSADEFYRSIKKGYMVKESTFNIGLCYLSANMVDEACVEFEKSASLGDTTAQQIILKHCTTEE